MMMEMESTSPSTVATTKLSAAAMEKISERLSSIGNLYFPRAVQPDAAEPSRRRSILLDLLDRDAAVFLERYGTKLTVEELQEFDALKDDYEINWHLKHLRSVLSPTTQQLKSRSVIVKNRRRAYMDKLINEGQYFSEDAMREREPYLHHEYIGKFQDATARGMARPGEKWSETLMRRAEEAVLIAKIRGEQMRLGVDESEWVGNEKPMVEEEAAEEEEEEEEEDEEEGAEEKETEVDKKEVDAKVDNEANPVLCSSEIPSENQEGSNDDPDTYTNTTGAHVERQELSEAEMQDQMDQFTYIMQQKFLSGEDHDHLDYSKIDEDEALDDHWIREANYDAEDRYFDED